VEYLEFFFHKVAGRKSVSGGKRRLRTTVVINDAVPAFHPENACVACKLGEGNCALASPALDAFLPDAFYQWNTS